MPKKTKATKPLPSALTVAGSAPHNSQTPLANAKSAEAAAAEPTASTSERQPRPTSGTTSAKPPAPLAAAPALPNAAVRERAPSPRALQRVKVTFALLEPHAQRVSLCGGFNAWSSDATPMNRQNGGLWETSLVLPPGRYEYKFVVDGQWLPDPNAQEQTFNGHGTLNSVIEVRA
jgi:hypothetical protein